MNVSSILGDLRNKFLHEIQHRTGSDVKTKIVGTYSNFQVPTTGLENHFQLKKLNSCKLEYDTQKILNRLRIIDQKDILLSLKEHCAHFSYKETTWKKIPYKKLVQYLQKITSVNKKWDKLVFYQVLQYIIIILTPS